MTSTKKEPVLVVLQLAGGNDALNTILPYGNPTYYDNRPHVMISPDPVSPINVETGSNPHMSPVTG